MPHREKRSLIEQITAVARWLEIAFHLGNIRTGLAEQVGLAYVQRLRYRVFVIHSPTSGEESRSSWPMNPELSLVDTVAEILALEQAAKKREASSGLTAESKKTSR